jgi:tRNA(fMet)-specific endonuclease VapC
MEPALLGLVLDSSIIIEAERKRQTVEEFLTGIRQRLGEIEIAISAVTLAELVHGVERANTPEIRQRRRAFINELKRHVPIHPVTDETGELAGALSGSQATKGIKLPIDDLLIGVCALEQGYAIHAQRTPLPKDPRAQHRSVLRVFRSPPLRLP